MTDIFTPEQRHRCMSSIHSRDTKPEIIVRKHLFAHGFRYRVNDRRLPGTPDIVLRKYRCVIFINGCFWHGHDGCSLYSLPKTNTDFWAGKVARNRERDAATAASLRAMGWNVITLWECQLKPKVREKTLAGLVRTLSYLLDGKSLLRRGTYDYPASSGTSLYAAEPYEEYGAE